jgi:hypothetical protein
LITDVVVNNNYFAKRVDENVTKTPAKNLSNFFENKNLKAQFLLNLT